jgi:hypothetical protein
MKDFALIIICCIVFCVTLGSIWWIVGFSIINIANYLFSLSIPTTHQAYFGMGILFTLISSIFKSGRK